MHIPVPPARVYEALDTDAGRAAFWAESAVESAGTILFRFANGFLHVATIIERRPPALLVLRYFDAVARFELSAAEGGGTELFLMHEGVGPEDWQETHAGWLNVLFPLKAWLAFGVDLRNHDPTRSWDHGYADP
jgi:uncharacterized protein YndB with AHSA1/START domain